jgi:nucleoside-diphosphate-sugar epimerase
MATKSKGKRIALVVGCTGMAGHWIIPTLLNSPDEDWEVYGLALELNEKTFISMTDKPFIPLMVNLNSKESIVKGLKEKGCPKITDVFWYAEANRPPKLANAVVMRHLLHVGEAFGPVLKAVLKVSPQTIHDQLYGQINYLAGSGKNERNQLWLGNIIDGLKETGAPLKHFVLGCGGKWYGMAIGPAFDSNYSSPFFEDKTKGPGPLCYFDAQEFVAQKAKENGFTWNVVLPSFIIGRCPELTPATQSFGLALAVYTILMKAQGKHLMYPGGVGSFHAKIQLSTSKKIAEVMKWSTQHENQIFNVTSCPAFSWSEVWESIGKYFDIPAENPHKDTEVGGVNSESMLGPHSEVVWRKIQAKFGLAPFPLQNVFNADFLDKSFVAGFDSIFSDEKIRKFRYPENEVFEGGSAMEILTNFFDDLVRDHIIPKPRDLISGIFSVITDDDMKSMGSTATSAETAKKITEEVKAAEIERRLSTDIQSGDILKFVGELSKLTKEDQEAEEREPVPEVASA